MNAGLCRFPNAPAIEQPDADRRVLTVWADEPIREGAIGAASCDKKGRRVIPTYPRQDEVEVQHAA
jgi:hypothetical protein